VASAARAEMSLSTVLAGIVEGERRAHRAFDAEAAQNGRSAMMSGSHPDAFAVERAPAVAIAHYIARCRVSRKCFSQLLHCRLCATAVMCQDQKDMSESGGSAP